MLTIRSSQVPPSSFTCDLKLPGSQSKKETEVDTKCSLTSTVKAFFFQSSVKKDEHWHSGPSDNCKDGGPLNCN